MWHGTQEASVCIAQEFVDALQPTPFDGCKGESLVLSQPSGFQVLILPLKLSRRAAYTFKQIDGGVAPSSAISHYNIWCALLGQSPLDRS